MSEFHGVRLVFKYLFKSSLSEHMTDIRLNKELEEKRTKSSYMYLYQIRKLLMVEPAMTLNLNRCSLLMENMPHRPAFRRLLLDHKLPLLWGLGLFRFNESCFSLDLNRSSLMVSVVLPNWSFVGVHYEPLFVYLCSWIWMPNEWMKRTWYQFGVYIIHYNIKL